MAPRLLTSTHGWSRGKRLIVVAVAAVIAALAVSACGSSSSSGSGGGSGSGGTASTSNGVSSSELTALKSTLNKAASVPQFVAPGPAFNAKSASGKSVLAVPSSSSIPYCSGIISDMQSIGNKIGVKVTNYPASGEQSQYQAAASQALAQKDNAFTTICGINPSLITPQLAKLKSANIPTVALLGDVSASLPSSVQAGTSIQLALAAKDLVDDAVVKNDGKPFDILLMTDLDIYGASIPTNAAKAEAAKVCPQCKVTVQNVPETAWSSGIGSQASTALIRDPKTTAVIALYDGMVPGLTAAVQNVHRSNMHIYTYGASSGVVKLIQSTHGLVAADIGASTPWTAYTQMDQVLRMLVGKKPVAMSKEYPPLRLWDSANVSQFFTSKAYGTAFPSDYMKLWGE